ncbi:ELECTRON TRANSPORT OXIDOREDUCTASE [Salix viminalis]|uniref:ELECTRON TRANSPORT OXIDOREDUCTASE n=1 Tax=Salix viminalis TaxID=40686 RepID=A0A9Q0YYP0_SALVM|nr:ELECTRON TRANSPORT OXIDOREDUCTASE [Salix viminalis]
MLLPPSLKFSVIILPFCLWSNLGSCVVIEEEAGQLRNFVDKPSFTDLHWGMFVTTIKGQGTDEQQQKWLPLAYKMQIIGCYAQTELGHGSNVQGLETTATFYPDTDEFVIHSPTLTSSKWWPGGLGKISTHAIVYARLITNGQEHGVHGITIGDIGMKFGNGAYNIMNNGVLKFDHIRIPKSQMLMRVLQVTREGKCVQSNVPRQLIYGTMVFVRQTIVADASTALSRSVCIAIRGSLVPINLLLVGEYHLYCSIQGKLVIALEKILVPLAHLAVGLTI